MLTVAALVIQCGVLADAKVMEAIVRLESGGNPHALAVNGDVELVRQPRNREEAVAMARWLGEHGYNFDAGLAQVNSSNLAWLGLDAVTVFEPCSNLRAAGRVLSDCYERATARWGQGERAMTAALSCYNTGNFTAGLRNGYAAAVRADAGRPVLVGVKAVRPTSERGARSKPLAVKRPPEAFGKSLADAFANARAGASKAAM